MALILIVLLSMLGIRSYNNSKKYKNLVITANKYMEEKNYDKAIEKFKQSLDYKKDQTYEEEIEKCKDELINLSYKELKNKKYEKSNNYLDVVFKHDENNKKAIKTKKDIKDKIQKDKYEEERKREEEVRKRIEEEVKKQVKSNLGETKKRDKVEKDSKVTKEKAESLIKAIKNKYEEMEFLGIKTVPNIPKESTRPYRKFPKEIENKKVYIFEALTGYNPDNYIAVGRYYVDFSGNIYKDTYPSNLECVRIK